VDWDKLSGANANKIQNYRKKGLYVIKCLGLVKFE